MFQTLCVFSQMKDTKHIRRFFFILSSGSCPRSGTWGYLGAKIKFRPAVCSLCYLLLNHWTKLNQIWCVSYLHEWGAQRQFFWPRPLEPWGGVKRSNIIYFNYKVNFKDFYSNLCVCSHKWKIQNISDGIFILLPESCPRGGWDFGALGMPRGSKKIFFQTWSFGISNRRGWQAEQNASNIFILGQTCDLGARSKDHISLTCQLKDFIPSSLCVFSQIKDRKHIEQSFHSVARVMPRDGTCGCWGSQKL